MARSDGYSTIQRLPQSSAPFLFPPNETPRCTMLFLTPKPYWSPNKVKLLHSNLIGLCKSTLRGGHFVSLMYSCILLSLLFPGHFYFGLGLIIFFSFFRSVVKPLFYCSASYVFVFIILRAAGISVFNDSCFVSIFFFLLVLHETSGTRIFFLNVLWLKKKNEKMNR